MGRKGNAPPGSEKMMSGALPNGTYYIYSFDGRLLAEYDVLGYWIRDYIYFGGQLVAEYRAGAFYYYASDQINSTRIVTDSAGAVVYSAAHEPYGGIQKTWASGYDPELKFSGKPRDTESELDYFGARYYDRTQYRFLNVDPVIPNVGAFPNSQWHNLFAYCGDNPISFYDPDGKWGRPVHYDMTLGLGLEVGLSLQLSTIIAAACQGIDESLWASSFNPLSTNRWHFPSLRRLGEVYEIAYSTLNPVLLGRSLHVIQDSYAHRGYSLSTLGHIFEGTSIDEMWRDLELLSDVVETTYRILQDFKYRLIDLATSIARSLALSVF